MSFLDDIKPHPDYVRQAKKVMKEMTNMATLLQCFSPETAASLQEQVRKLEKYHRPVTKEIRACAKFFSRQASKLCRMKEEKYDWEDWIITARKAVGPAQEGEDSYDKNNREDWQKEKARRAKRAKRRKETP